jgi:uncharacterized protein
MAFLDAELLRELRRVSPFSGYNRWNWTTYEERDHIGDARLSLRERLAQDAERNGVRLPGGPIFLLTHLLYIGYVFNPVSFYYCYDAVENLELIMAEVNSTFSETHNYGLDASNRRTSSTAKRYTTSRVMHVSPFMDIGLQYDWILAAPGECLVSREHAGSRQALIYATLQLDRRPWERRELYRVLAANPLMTLRVISAIHWQALKL